MKPYLREWGVIDYYIALYLSCNTQSDHENVGSLDFSLLGVG